MTRERTPVRARRDGPIRARAVLALAHREGVRLARHPFVLGLGLTTVLGLWFSEGNVTNLRAATGLGLMFFPIAAGVLLAANQATLRSHRDRADDLFDSMPMGRPARTRAHLLSAGYAAGAGGVLVFGWITYHRLSSAIGWPAVGDTLEGPVLMAGAAVIGVVMARWIPSGLGGFLGILIVGGVEIVFMNLGPNERMIRWLAPWPGWDQGPVGFWPRPTTLHLVFLCSLIAVLCVLALVRSGATVRLIVAGATVVAVTATSGVALARAPSLEQLRAIARRVEAGGQICESRANARYCAHDGYEDLIARWAISVEPVLARVPAAVAERGLIVRQRLMGERLDELPAAAREQLADPLLRSWPYLPASDGGLHPGFQWADGIADLTLGLSAASWAVGMPLTTERRPATQADVDALGEGRDEPQADGTLLEVGDTIESRCVARGQARAVVTLWLATQGNPSAASWLRRDQPNPDDGIDVFLPGAETSEGTPPEITGDGLVSIVPPGWLTDIASPITWGRSDVRYALQLLERPASEVAAAIGARWGELTDPATPTARLVAALGLTPLPAEQLAMPGTTEPVCA